MSRNIERQPEDGEVSVRREIDINSVEFSPNNDIVIHTVRAGAHSVVSMSEYNARRLFAMLSLILDLPIQKTAQKQIKLT